MSSGHGAVAGPVFRELRYTDPVVRALEDELQQEYVQRYGDFDQAPIEPNQFTPPEGIFLVGFIGNEPVVSGAFRRFDDDTVEVKRMFTPHDHRGGGYARRLLGELEYRARRAGYARVVLETGDKQPEAIALYESSGYEPTEPFGYYAKYEESVFFGKKLLDSTVVDLGRTSA